MQALRVYIYEALAIVVASVIIGLIIGLLVAVTLTLQTSLFVEIPYVFEFPWYLFVLVTVMSLGCAVLGSYLPARVLLKKRIASAIKAASA